MKISASTIDRMLKKEREEKTKYYNRRKSYDLKIRRQIPVRRFSEWDNPPPGFLEADFVAHCGGNMRGKFIHTFTVTDIATGWTTCIPILYRDQNLVVAALAEVQKSLPFKILGLDTDNDGAFINESLISYCKLKGIDQTRSRPYKSNDQSFVEQKNRTVVRRLVGYGRYEGIDAVQALSSLFRLANAHINFFLPSFKLIEKSRDGKKYRKLYDKPKTPCDRLIEHEDITADTKQLLQASRKELDPVRLAHEIFLNQKLIASFSKPDLPSVDSKDISDLKSFIKQLPVLWKEGEIRPTHQRKKREPRYWRTRVDPFDEYWPKILQWLDEDPDLNAKIVLEQLFIEYPDSMLSNSQLRTLQRRIKDYRKDMAEALIFGVSPESPSFEEYLRN